MNFLNSLLDPNLFTSRVTQFLCMIALVALLISFTGLFIFFKTIFFCVKRFFISMSGVPSTLLAVSFNKKSNNQLSAKDLVEKNTLKDKINKFARETSNIVKSNNYLSERSENYTPDDYDKEIKILQEIYVKLDLMKIKTKEDLDEVKFLFNDGKLRNDEEIVKYYNEREIRNNKESYKENSFISDIIEIYTESDISQKLIIGFSMFFLSAMYIFYKFINTDPYDGWYLKDFINFVCYIIIHVFDFTYEFDVFSIPYVDELCVLMFDLSLILSLILAFIIGGGLVLINNWVSEIEIRKCYIKAGKKKKPDILLGVNTASYLYVLHKILNRK